MFGIPTNRGLIRNVILVLIALLILSYFGFNLRSIVNSPTFQDNWHFVTDLAIKVWNDYLKAPATLVWDLFIRLVWTPAMAVLQHIPGNNTQATSSAMLLQQPGT